MQALNAGTADHSTVPFSDMRNYAPAPLAAAKSTAVGPAKAASTVFVIDDDSSISYALSSLFRTVGLASTGFESAQDFLETRHPTGPSCLVLDIRLPGMNGLDFQEKLIQNHVFTPVVLMTGHGDVPMSVRGMKAGAIDFLMKPFRDQDMLDAVFEALERDRRRLQQSRGVADLIAGYAKLTPREQQVVRLVAEGKMNKQVAGTLNISEITVKIHRRSAMTKLGTRTLADLVRLVEKIKEAV
jgi:FixJ family two-component response regulator